MRPPSLPVLHTTFRIVVYHFEGVAYAVGREAGYIISNRDIGIWNRSVGWCIVGVMPVTTWDVVSFVDVYFEAVLRKLAVGYEATRSGGIG